MTNRTSKTAEEIEREYGVERTVGWESWRARLEVAEPGGGMVMNRNRVLALLAMRDELRERDAEVTAQREYEHSWARHTTIRSPHWCDDCARKLFAGDGYWRTESEQQFGHHVYVCDDCYGLRMQPTP